MKQALSEQKGYGEFLLQENIDDLQKLSDRLLHISDENGYIYADDLSELHQAIHEKIIDLYSQRGRHRSRMLPCVWQS